jgi:hypothetical protein
VSCLRRNNYFCSLDRRRIIDVKVGPSGQCAKLIRLPSSQDARILQPNSHSHVQRRTMSKTRPMGRAPTTPEIFQIWTGKEAEQMLPCVRSGVTQGHTLSSIPNTWVQRRHGLVSRMQLMQLSASTTGKCHEAARAFLELLPGFAENGPCVVQPQKLCLPTSPHQPPSASRDTGDMLP